MGTEQILELNRSPDIRRNHEGLAMTVWVRNLPNFVVNQQLALDLKITEG